MNKLCFTCTIYISESCGEVLIRGGIFGSIEKKSLINPMIYDLSSRSNLDINFKLLLVKYIDDTKIGEVFPKGKNKNKNIGNHRVI